MTWPRTVDSLDDLFFRPITSSFWVSFFDDQSETDQ